MHEKHYDHKIHKQFCLKYHGYSIYHCEVCNIPIMRIRKDDLIIIKDNRNEDFDFYFHKSETASAIIHAMSIVEALINETGIDYFQSMFEFD